MIQRKDSIAYIEFLRGKYQLDKPSYIIDLLNGCSLNERELIGKSLFDDLWSNLWFSGDVKKPQTERMIKEYHKSKSLFTLLQKELPTLITRCIRNYTTPEWEFPKGRRSSRESNIKCAIREFEEETDLESDEYILFENVNPICEEYIGSNGIRYKHIYYYALYTGSRDLSINQAKYEQYSEIGDIQWLTIEECFSRIREEHPTKKDIIKKTNDYIMNWSKDLFLKE